jgi:peptidylprolyl isomerase/peptidyl-prolyl cis-trans isomerase D
MANGVHPTIHVAEYLQRSYLCQLESRCSITTRSINAGVTTPMGAISKIRQLSPYFLGTVAVLFIAFMVIQDQTFTSLNQGPRNPATVVVGTVNGDEIYLAEYESRVKEYLEQQKQQNPQAEFDDEAVRQQVWDEMVNQLLRKQQAEKLGLVVTRQELLDAFYVNPPDYLTSGFKDSTGRVNMQLYRDVVGNPDKLADFIQGGEEDKARLVSQFKNDLIKIEDFLRIQKLDEALRAAVNATASVISPAYAEREYITNNAIADVKYVAIDATRIADKDVTVSDADIKAYYEANKQYFEQKKSRKLNYMMIPLVPSLRDTQQAAERSMKLQIALAEALTPASKDSIFNIEMSAKSGSTNEFRQISEIDPGVATVLSSMAEREVFGPLTTPEGIKYIRLDGRREGENVQVKASHILIDFGSDKDAAKVEADKLYARAKKGDDFATLARENSKDPGSAVNGGDLGFFGKGRMVKPFEDAAFAASVGQVVGPVESQFGYHIIKVTDKQSTEIKYSEIVIKPFLSTGTRQRALADASTAVKQIEAGKNLDAVAKEMKRQSSQTPFFQEETPMFGSRQVTRFAFSGAKGDVKSFDLRGQNLVVAQITDAREDGIQPLEDISENLKAKLTVDKKVELVKARANEIAAALASQGLDAATMLDPTLEVRTMTQLRDNGQLQGYSNEFEVTRAAFTVPVGNVSKAIRGNRGWFIIQPLSRQDADLSRFASERTITTQMLASSAKSSAYSVWLQKLRDNAAIEDLRYNQE